MGGSSKQTVGYKYFAGLQVVIGNCIEQILNINPDNRGWIFTRPEDLAQLKNGDTSMVVNKPDLFGGDKQEGGWVGAIDIHTGREEYLRQNEYLAQQDSELVSAFPCLSHLVFHGQSEDKGFQLVSMSGMLKDVLYWPKRTRIKDDGSEQWYKSYVREDGLGVIVCEIGAYNVLGGISVSNDEFNEVPVGLGVTGVSDFQMSEQGSFNATAAVENGSAFLPDSIKEEFGVLDYFESVRLLTASYAPNFGFWVALHTNSGFNGVQDYLKNTGSATSISFDIAAFNRYLFVEIFCRTKIDNLKFIFSGVGHALISSGVEYGSFDIAGNTASVRSYFVFLIAAGGTVSISYNNKTTNGNLFVFNAVRSFMSLNVIKIKSENNVSAVDINPVHKIREIITDDTAMNKPESMINNENFEFAARRIWDEGLGVSGVFTEKSCKDAIDELLYHIEAGARLNRQTGQYEIILFRDDLLELDNAQSFDKSNIKSFSIEIANIDDVINSVNVNYYDRDNIKDSSFSLDEIGSVMSSEVNAQTLDFPYFMNRRNAELVGNWKLKQLSTPTRKGTFTTGKYEARKINKYDVVKLTWANQNMFEVPVRIMKIGLGDGRDNTVTLDWVEVIPYSSINYPTINVDPSTSVALPPQPNESIVFEMPYFEAVQQFGQAQVDAELANNPDLGYLMVATKKPQNNSINALLFTDNGTGYQQASIVDYCPVATLDQEISYLDTSFAVKNVASISQAEVGTLILCDDELMVYQSYDTATKILSAKRAALDTVPKLHSQDAIFYFYDAFNAFDSEQYVLSEVINAKVLTTTPSGVQGLGDVTALSVEMDARPIRPYPPANVKINDEYYPLAIETDLIVTWVDRNRLQQTGGSVLGWTDGGVTIESGTSTMLTIKELDVDDLVIATHNINATGTNTYTLTIAAMQAETRSIEVTAKTVRDGYECLQPYEHTFELSQFFSAPYDLTVEFKND